MPALRKANTPGKRPSLVQQERPVQMEAGRRTGIDGISIAASIASTFSAAVETFFESRYLLSADTLQSVVDGFDVPPEIVHIPVRLSIQAEFKLAT